MTNASLVTLTNFCVREGPKRDGEVVSEERGESIKKERVVESDYKKYQGKAIKRKKRRQVFSVV